MPEPDDTEAWILKTTRALFLCHSHYINGFGMTVCKIVVSTVCWQFISQFLPLGCFQFSQIHQNIVHLSNTTFIYDKCPHSLAVGTLVKYERNSKDPVGLYLESIPYTHHYPLPSINSLSSLVSSSSCLKVNGSTWWQFNGSPSYSLHKTPINLSIRSTDHKLQPSMNKSVTDKGLKVSLHMRTTVLKHFF